MASSSTAPNRTANRDISTVLQNVLGTNVVYPTGIALSNSTPAHVAIVDSNGDQVVSFGGGTQYTNGGTPPANPIGPTLEFNNAGVWATVGSANPLPIVGTITANTPQSVVSTNNSSTATLTSGSVFTGTGDDCLNYSEIRVTVISNVASASDGLSIQQSSDNSNWDITDIYTVAANTGKTFVVPRQARYMRVVYTNGGTGQASFRLQAILNKSGTSASSQRPADAYTNETDLTQQQSFLMGYNGTTWDRLRSTIANGLSVDVTRLSALVAGAAVIGKVGIDQTTPGTTNLVALAANQSVNVAQINGVTTLMGNGATGTGSQRVTTASDNSAVALWGHGATAASVPANAVYGGRRGTTALPTAVTDGQNVGAMADKFGRQVMIPNGMRDIVLPMTQLTLTATTTETSLIAAVASTFNDLLSLVVINTSATATQVDFRDSTGGTIRLSLYVPAGDTRGVVFNTPMPQNAVNTAWTAKCGTSVSSIIITGNYVTNK